MLVKDYVTVVASGAIVVSEAVVVTGTEVVTCSVWLVLL